MLIKYSEGDKWIYEGGYIMKYLEYGWMFVAEYTMWYAVHIQNMSENKFSSCDKSLKIFLFCPKSFQIYKTELLIS